MTRQIPEQLRVDGRSGRLRRGEPLALLVRRAGLPASVRGSTGVQRGYVGEWEVTGDRLWLVRVLDSHLEEWPAAMTRLCDEQRGPVFAEWFSGRLVVELGEPIGWGGSRASEVELTLEVRRGVVVTRRTIEPRPWLLATRMLVVWAAVALFWAPLVLLLLRRC